MTSASPQQRSEPSTAASWSRVDARRLRAWPLPSIAEDADKEDRGRVLIIGGSREIPGAVLLAATAALRAGAGKLVIATGQSIAPQLAAAMPEARVLALPETTQGSFRADSVALLAPITRNVSATLVGPGMMDEIGTVAFVTSMLPLVAHAPLVLDALAMDAVRVQERFNQPVLLTPHAGEMAHLLGPSKEEVTAEPAALAVRACESWNATVALKGATTWIASPSGGRWMHEAGHPGLATSGSGDVLAGVIAGLVARQADLDQACAWGVALHALAGQRLTRRLGPVGFLARELPGEVPALLKQLHPRAIGVARRAS